MDKRIRIAIYASGGGSNAGIIMERFKQHKIAQVALVVSDQPGAGVLALAKQFGVESLVASKSLLADGPEMLDLMRSKEIDFIVLAGYLRKIPNEVVQVFSGRIVNIHPSLLPKFGGKGMYGMRVHTAVVAAQEKESGMTIHFVNENYDEGAIIMQVRCSVDPSETAESLQKKVLQLEHLHYASVVEDVCLKTVTGNVD